LTTAIIIFITLAVLGVVYFWKKSSKNGDLETFQPKELSDNLSEPIISYTLYALDTRLNRRLEMQAPKEFSNQYGILNGQTIELHWNVLNADWISIDGVGFVQAIGKKEFYLTQNTQYKITAKNRNHSEEVTFFVRVFPLPVMEKLMVKMPEITTNNIDLFKTQIPTIQRLNSINFPTLQIPSVIQIQKDNTAVKPKITELNKVMLRQTQHNTQQTQHSNEISRFARNDNMKSFKSRLFDKMENSFKDNYKLKDIIQTIRKHYE